VIAAYEKDRAITVMTQLTDAYLANDITAFDKLMATHGEQSAVWARPTAFVRVS